MSKVIFFGIPLSGTTNPTYCLVEELVSRGEEVIYYLTDDFKSKIERTGAAFRENRLLKGMFASQGNDMKSQGAGRRDEDEMNALIGAAMHTLKSYKSVIEDIIGNIAAEKPHYIIHDSNAFFGKQIARLLGVPAISSITTFAYCKRLFEQQPGFVIRDILNLPERFATDTAETAAAFKSISAALGRQYGIENFDLMDIFFSEENLNIVYTSQYFQPYAEVFEDKFKFVGPSIYKQEGNADFPLEKLDGKPLIYIAFGTIFNGLADLYMRCFEAFGGSDCQVVLSAGNRIDVSGLGRIPDNFLVRSFVPQVEILEKADVFITHGGMNSVSEGLVNNVPLVILPQALDQFVVARRVEALGAGLYVRSADVSPAGLREAVDEVLSKDMYRLNSKKIGNSFNQAGGVQKAVDEIFLFKKTNGL